MNSTEEDEGIPTISQLTDDPPRRLVVAWCVAGGFCVATLLSWLIFIYLHIRVKVSNLGPKHWKKIRRLIVFISFMIPVFSVTAYLSLFIFPAHPAFTLIRDLMEAYVLAAFFRLILMYMRGPKNAVALLENEKPQRLLASPPLCCLRPCASKTVVTKSKLRLLRFGIVQLAVVSTITGILAVIFALNDDYVSGDMTFKHNAFPLTYPSVSLIFGLWALFALYKASHEVLKHFRTTVKFVCIKLVLILLVLQELLLSILVKADVIESDDLFSSEAKAEAWSCFLLVIEMFAISIMYHWGFSVSEYNLPLPSPPTSSSNTKL